jgi:hypothetical protein
MSENMQPDAKNDEIGMAAEAVRLAKEELEKAQAMYDRMRRQATEKIQAARDLSVGDAIDGTLNAVRRHPGIGLAAAGLLGYFLGRLFRR